jgi:chromosome segregation ATPase
VTVLDYVPGLKGTAKHRGKSGLQLQRELAAAERRIAALTAGIDQISAERNTAEKRVDNAKLALDTAGKEIEQLEATVRLRDQTIADLKRKVDVGVRAEHVIAKTQEIDTEQVRRYCVKPLHESPMAVTDPGRVPPSWAKQAEPTA